MKKTLNTATVTLWANRTVALILGVLLVTIHKVLEWYCQYRVLTQQEQVAIIVAFYCCAVAVAVALWNMDTLLRAIREGQVFIQKNVRRIRVVQWCCGITSLICLPAACYYYPLVFVVIIMAFLALVVSVVGQVMSAAVTIREENDLTI